MLSAVSAAWPAAGGLDRLTHRSLSGRVAERLVRLIQEDGLRPGDFLPSQAELSERFGVSRPILREAMQGLAGSGLIEVHNGRGAMVAPIKRDPLLAFFRRALQFERTAVVELMEVRKGIEVQAALLAAQRRTPEQLDAMRRIVDEMRLRLRDTAAFNALDLELHLAIVDAAANTMLLHLMASVRETLHDSITEGFRHRQTDELLARTQTIHEQLVDAIESGDPSRARHAMERHFDDAIAAILTQPPTPGLSSRT
jgi:GntR family transcriptional regulator, transcriptional repressor for pyruvate dehydrogenase complex